MTTDRRGWGRAWLAWLIIVIGSFLGLEIAAANNMIHGDLLSNFGALVWVPAGVFLAWLAYHFAVDMAPRKSRRRGFALPGVVSAIWGIGSGVWLLVAAAVAWA